MQFIKNGTAIKPTSFTQTNLMGLTALRASTIICEKTDLDTDHIFSKYFKICKITVDDIIIKNPFTDDEIQYIASANPSKETIVISFDSSQTAYIIYFIVQKIKNTPIEIIGSDLKQYISDTSLEQITLHTIDRICKIMSNYETFVISEVEYDKVNYDKYSKTLQKIFDKYPVLNKVLHKDIETEKNIKTTISSNKKQSNTTYIDQDELLAHQLAFGDDYNYEDPIPIITPKESSETYVRPPIPAYTDRLIGDDSYSHSYGNNNEFLEPIQKGITMQDTNLVKEGSFPDPEDLLGITSYNQYAPKPLKSKSPNKSEIQMKNLLEIQFTKLSSLMGNRLFNKEYAKNLLQSGMDPNEVFSILDMSV